MIHGASNHPVLVKKIQLRVWSLREEVEAELEKRLVNHPELSEEDRERLVHELVEKYSTKSAAKSQEVQMDQQQGLRLVEENTEEAAAELESASAEDEAEKAQAPSTEETAAEAKEEEAAPASEENPESAQAANPEEAQATETPESVQEGAQNPEQAASEATTVDSPESEASNQPASLYEQIIHCFKRSKTVPKEKQAHGMVLLSDVLMDRMAFFSTAHFSPGQSIVIEFCIPFSFIVSAEVVSSKRYNLKSKIISPNRPEYRVLAKFTFQMTGERTLLRNFLKSIEPELPKDSPKKKKKEEVSDAGDGDDLADLGL